MARRAAHTDGDGRFHYFAGQRWLPDDHVHAVAVGERAVYLATEKGWESSNTNHFTLLKKAAYFERHLEEWGQKRLGLMHKLEWDGGLKEFVREAGDNDGGYSGDYLAAQSYRYAVTKDPEARREAVNTFQALRWLETMTGIPASCAAYGPRASAATRRCMARAAIPPSGMTRLTASSSGRATPR